MPMSYAQALDVPRASLDTWVAPTRESLERRFEGMELERVKELLRSDEGKKQLLTLMKESDPSLAGNVDTMLSVVDRNVEQLEKKESFLKKVLMMPVHAAKSVGMTIAKHPVLSAIGTAGIVALLIYFFGPAAGTVGALGQRATELFEGTVLSNVPVPTPGAGFGAAADVSAVGGLAGPEAMAEAAESLESAGDLMIDNLEAARAAQMTDDAMRAVSGAADNVLQNPATPNMNPVEEFFRQIAPRSNP